MTPSNPPDVANQDARPPQRLSAEQFADLMTPAYGRLWGLAIALVGDRHEAEDLVQEAAVVALRKLDDFAPETNFAAWMAKIIRMHALNWRRKRAGRQTAPADPVELDASSPAAERTIEPAVGEAAGGETKGIREGFDDSLASGLNRLDTVPRACLLLRIVHELTYDEIAAMLEIPAGTAMSHVHRSKQRLRSELASA